MVNQSKNTLLRSRLVQGSAKNILEAELRHLFVNLKTKGVHETDTSGLYSRAASVCFNNTFLATGTFSENKGILK
tara:strand:+ start:1074 stop:1298 length:225 start_codon:yes stop_codon:yes gene_type:complete